MLIVVSMAFPNIENFIFIGKERIEEQNMKEISDAMGRYVRHNRSLPPHTGDWWEEFAPYTDLGENNLRYDPWGNERVYRRATDTVMFKDGTYVVYYGVVYGYGFSGCYENTTGCDTAPDSLNTFGSDDFFSAADFRTLEAGVGDFIAKYGDGADKLEAYNTTKLRLDKISDALTEYSERVYNEAIISTNPNTGTSYLIGAARYLPIFYPPNDISYNANVYHPFVRNDLSIGGVNIIDNGQNSGVAQVYTGNNNLRRYNSMVSLMRFLGLPDEYCCSALETFSSGSRKLDMPFYYYSNPRQKGGTCGSRPSATASKLPARISTRSMNESGVCG